MRGRTATWPSTAPSPTRCLTSSSAGPARRSSSTTTTSTWRRAFVREAAPMRRSRTSSTFPGRSPTTGGSCPRGSAGRSTRASSRTTSSASIPTAGGELPAELRGHRSEPSVDFDRARSLRRCRGSRGWCAPISVDPLEFDRSQRASQCSREEEIIAARPSFSCCASTARILRRTSSAASAPTSSSSRPIRRCTGG